jgi:hypothetical protein
MTFLSYGTYLSGDDKYAFPGRTKNLYDIVIPLKFQYMSDFWEEARC